METINSNINSIKVVGGKIKKLKLLYSDTDETTLNVVGDLREYSHNVSNETLIVYTIDEHRKNIVNIRGNDTPKIELLEITVPHSFKGILNITSIDTNIFLNDCSDRFTDMTLEGVNIKLYITNGTSNIELDSVNSSIDADNVSGTIDLDGVSSSANINSISDNLRITADGVNSNITITNSDANYDIEVDGLSSKMIYHDQVQKSLIGSSKFVSPYKEGLPLVKISCNGLNSVVRVK